MNWWKPKQSPAQPSSSESPRQTHHGGLFHNLQSHFFNFLQKPQNLFFNGCRATAQTPNITLNQTWDALKQLYYPRFLLYNTRQNLRNYLQREGTIKDYVIEATMTMLQIPLLSDDDLLKLAYELQYWAKQELNSNSDRKKNLAVSDEEIQLATCDVPVYNIKFSDYEVAQMASRTNQKKTILGYFLGKEDAKAYAEHGLVASVPSGIPYVDSERLDVAMDYNMTLGHLKLIPEASEVKNALEVKKKAGLPCEAFYGTPVFESRNLSLCQGCLRITNEGCSYKARLFFFKKEDLEKSLAKARIASPENFVDTETHIEVAAFEDIIKAMKDDSTSEWNSVYFSYPGQDIKTNSLADSYEDIVRGMDNFQ